jgi:hypothetical protein
MITKERFAQGMTFQQYLDQMGTNKEKFVQLLQEVKIKSEDRAALDKLGKKLKILVLTELVEGHPGVELRVFLRDKNPDLMDQYLNQGLYRSIPVFAFFDESMKEVARFLERPPAQTEEIEKKMLEVRRALRAERYPEWREGVVKEIRSLLKV